MGKKGSDQLGISVCVSGKKIIAGAPNQNGSPYPYYGAAYIFKESSEDCNANNSPDECDIEDGTSGDLNSDGVPDEYQCFADTDNNGAVDIEDLLTLIAFFGTSESSVDFDFNSTVDISDLPILIGSFGPCQ